MIRIPKSPIVAQSTLVVIGSGLVTAAAYLPPPWGLIVAAVGGLLGGKALLKRPGDVKAVP
jgi:hypothetical protein